MLGINDFHKPNKLNLVYSEMESNWDVWIRDGSNQLLSIAKVNGASDSHFGSINHVIKLMNCGYFNFNKVAFTDFGLLLFSGLHTVLLWDSDGSVNIEKTKNSEKWYSIKK